MTRHRARQSALAALLLTGLCATAASDPVAPPPVIEVFQETTCDCCSAWVRHLETEGLQVKVTAFEDPFALQALKRAEGVPPELAACHTARVDGYLIEGHVSAREIRRLLAERPAIKGLVVPRMPTGAPGMAGVQLKPYDVLALEASGSTRIFATHEPPAAPEKPTASDPNEPTTVDKQPMH